MTEEQETGGEPSTRAQPNDLTGLNRVVPTRPRVFQWDTNPYPMPIAAQQVMA